MVKSIRHKVFVSSLLQNDRYGCFNAIKTALEANDIELIALRNTSDIWVRDYMPIRIGDNTFVTYRYRPDYLWSPERIKYITTRFSTPAKIMEHKGYDKDLPFYRPEVELRMCNLILDGGNIVVCGDKIILTDKVFIENRPKTQEWIIDELQRAFGKEVIIIPSDPYEIEDLRLKDMPEKYELPLCHADGVLAPIDDETILIADYGEDPLGYVPQLMNVLSRHFKLDNIKHFDFGEDRTPDSWVYINFLRVGDLVLIPHIEYKNTAIGPDSQRRILSDRQKACNEKAKKQLSGFLGVDKIAGIDITALSTGKNNDDETINFGNYGGGLHCISWEA